MKNVWVTTTYYNFSGIWKFTFEFQRWEKTEVWHDHEFPWISHIYIHQILDNFFWQCIRPGRTSKFIQIDGGSWKDLKVISINLPGVVETKMHGFLSTFQQSGDGRGNANVVVGNLRTTSVLRKKQKLRVPIGESISGVWHICLTKKLDKG